MLHRKTVLMASVLAGFVLACGPGDNNNTGGAGGTGGTGAAGGMGGTGGSGGNMPDPPGPKDPDATLRAAIFMGSCVPDDGVQRFLNRFYTRLGGPPGEPELDDYLPCFASKTNGCQAIEECLGIKVDLSGPCAPTCTGNVLKVCDDQLAFTQDCSKLGLTCSQAEGECVSSTPAGPTCDFDTFQEVCQDGAPRICSGTEVSGPVCADYGLACKEAPFGGVACLGTGASCTSTTVSPLYVNFDEGIACDGTALRTCVSGGEHAVECNTLGTGFTCQTMGAANFCGLSNTCDPNAGNDSTCEGDSVVVCNAGRVDKIDCKTLGFTGCNATWGTCSPSVYDQAPQP